MEASVRETLEKLFAMSNGISDPVAKLQFDAEAFGFVSQETGFGLEAIQEILKKEQAEIRRAADAAKLEHHLQELRESLRDTGDTADVLARMFKMSQPHLHAQGDRRQAIMARLGGQLERYEDYIWERTGQKFAGVQQSVFPTLNQALNGFQGVTMVAGPTNSSKTQFFLHNVVSVLKDNPETAVLYFALDMPEAKLLSRLAACVTGVNVEQFEQGSNLTGEGAPLTDEDLQSRHIGLEWLREHLGKRLFLFDRSYFPNLRVCFDDVKDAVALVKKESGLKRVSIWVDYMDQLIVPEQDKMKDIAVDQERVQALLDWHLLNPNDPILSITEVNKESTKEGNPVTNAGVMGTSRKVYAPDNVLIINPLSNEELMSWTENFIGGGPNDMRLKINHNHPVEYSDKEVKEKAFRIEAEHRRRWLADINQSLGTITVTKVRDGGRRCKVFYTNFFRCSRFEEGLRIVEPGRDCQ